MFVGAASAALEWVLPPSLAGACAPQLAWLPASLVIYGIAWGLWGVPVLFCLLHAPSLSSVAHTWPLAFGLKRTD